MGSDVLNSALVAALARVKQEHAKFRLSDDHSVEASYSGPTGFGLGGQAVGCRPKLEEFGITSVSCTRLENLAKSLENHLFGRNESDKADRTTGEAAMSDLVDLIGRFALAAKHPE